MDISFYTTAGAENTWSLQECAMWARGHDFDCIRLTDRGVLDAQLVLEQGGAAQVKETLAAQDVYLSCIAAHCNLLDDDVEVREAESQRLQRAIRTSRAVDCPVVICGSGAPVKNGQFYGMYSSPPGNASDRTDELVDRYREMFAPVARAAEESDVKVALDVAVRMGNIGCNPEMWDRLLDAATSDYIGLSCDPSHWVWMKIMPAEDVIREYAGKWYFADVKDCEVSERMLYRQGIIGNWWWQYRVPGRGDLDWAKVTGALIESGYDYVLCVENEDRGMPGLEGFAYGCRHLRGLLPSREGHEAHEAPRAPWLIR